MKAFKTSLVLFAVVSVFSVSVLADPPSTGGRAGQTDPDCNSQTDSQRVVRQEGAAGADETAPAAGSAAEPVPATPPTAPRRR